MTESGLEMRSNLPQNSSISLPLAPLSVPRNKVLLLGILFLCDTSVKTREQSEQTTNYLMKYYYCHIEGQ